MLLALAISLALASPPSQGVTFRLLKPTGASSAEAEAVFSAMKRELEGQGYAVVTSADAKAHGTLAGTVKKGSEGYVVKLSLTRDRDALVLEDVSEAAKSSTELPKAGTEVAKQLATAWRMANGVRVRVK